MDEWIALRGGCDDPCAQPLFRQDNCRSRFARPEPDHVFVVSGEVLGISSPDMPVGASQTPRLTLDATLTALEANDAAA